MSIGGGLSDDYEYGAEKTVGRNHYDGHSRPCSVDTNDPTFSKTIWVCVLNVGDVPPDLVHARERGGEQRGQCEGEGGPHRAWQSGCWVSGGGREHEAQVASGRPPQTK